MRIKPRYNFGNYPNSADYDPNIPIGHWHWDDEPEEQQEPDEDIQLEEED